MTISNKTYDRIKFISLLIAPIVAFVASIVSIWGIPYGEQIVATLTAVDVLIGAFVVIMKKRYDDAIEESESNGEGGE